MREPIATAAGAFSPSPGKLVSSTQRLPSKRSTDNTGAPPAPVPPIA
jgi:hypothetical protein